MFFHSKDQDYKIKKVNVDFSKEIQDKLPIIPSPKSEQEILKCYGGLILAYTAKLNEIERLNKLKCSCRKGCSACCQQIVYIDQGEYKILQMFLKNLNKKSKAEMIDKCLNILDIVKQHEIQYTLDYETFQKQGHIIQINNEKYFLLGLKCPLLKKDNACLAYQIRPVSCWDYRSYGKRQDCANDVHAEGTLNIAK